MGRNAIWVIKIPEHWETDRHYSFGQFQRWVGKIPWRRKWQPTLVFSPGKSHGWRILVGYSPWGCKELDRTERLHFHFFTFLPGWFTTEPVDIIRTIRNSFSRAGWWGCFPWGSWGRQYRVIFCANKSFALSSPSDQNNTGMAANGHCWKWKDLLATDRGCCCCCC